MRYITQKEYKGGQIIFYFKFIEPDNFLDYLLKQHNLKDKVNALSFAVSKNANTVRVIKPLGTNESEFEEEMKKFFQTEYNVSSLFGKNDGNYNNEYINDLFGSIFGGLGK